MIRMGNPIDRDFVTMGAYGANYNVARKADTYLATIAYTIPVIRNIR